MNGLPSAQEVVERALEASRAEGCVVIVQETSQAEVRYANNTTTTNGVRRARSVTAISVQPVPGGTAAGVASQSGPGDVVDLVRASESHAGSNAPADDAFPLVEPAGTDATYSDPPARTDLGALAGVLDYLGDAFRRARDGRRVLAGFAEHGVDTIYLGASTGVRRRHAQPTGKVELVARSDDGSRSAWAGRATASLEDVDMHGVEDSLLERLAWADRRIDVPPGRYETILPPDAVADLVLVLAEAASGKEAEDGQSAFSAPGGRTRVGERITGAPLDLWSDPGYPGLECTPFAVATASGPSESVFDNGLPLERSDWVRGGTLQRLRYHRAGASRSGVEAAPAVDNLVLAAEGATASLSDLVARTERGLLLTCLWYIREVDPTTLLLTGLTRDGVYLVERGEIAGAVNNFRFNESPLDVLAKSVEVGRTERALSREWGEWWNRTAMPALRVAEFNMSTVSPAT